MGNPLRVPRAILAGFPARIFRRITGRICEGISVKNPGELLDGFPVEIRVEFPIGFSEGIPVEIPARTPGRMLEVILE